ncbi:MAG TPA: TspO/MBR family protein [Micrococcaceae bacterium]|nr:TspO/MBR family protein [Micrococcaceae bacterium]
MAIRRWLFAFAPVAAAGIGGFGARNAPRTYRRLRKPRWAPPAAAFGPVWSVLYLLISAAGWRLSRGRVRASGSLHLLQLALNAAWPVMFFRIRNKRVSLLTIALLDCALFMEILKLRREDPVAAALLVPYLCWSGFATALNAAVSDPTPKKPHRRLVKDA